MSHVHTKPSILGSMLNLLVHRTLQSSTGVRLFLPCIYAVGFSRSLTSLCWVSSHVKMVAVSYPLACTAIEQKEEHHGQLHSSWCLHRVLGMQLHVMSHIDTLRSSKDANHPRQALGFEGHAVKIAPGVFTTLLGSVSRLPGNYPTLD